MGSVEAIAAGKAQLVEGLKPGGTAVLNADDERVAAMRAKARHAGRVITYRHERVGGREGGRASRRSASALSRFLLRTPRGRGGGRAPDAGRHNVLNALARRRSRPASASAPRRSRRRSRTAAPSEMRGEVLRFAAGFTVVDDSYNSNPRSLLSMAEAVAGGRRGRDAAVVVAGEMLELGAEGAALHREAGREIAGFGMDVLWGVRGLARELVEGAREARDERGRDALLRVVGGGGRGAPSSSSGRATSFSSKARAACTRRGWSKP